ncbi:phosphatase PAP2 family protein [Paenibacillus filicis]|uniref:Phosphatase PAP2 family protein n=1 Tax=Paenibacillus filicis TaxID=669464 RepID=A0ABU9DED1_9BACL
MEQTRFNYNGMLFGFILFIGFGALALALILHPSNPFDVQIAAFVQGFEHPSVTKVMELFTFIGSAKGTLLTAALIMVILFVGLRHRMELMFMMCVIGGSAVLNQLLKMVFHRERPFVHRLIEETGYSFPSGHAMGALALYGALAFVLWRHTSTRLGRGLLLAACCAMIFLIGLSRVYLGVHYPSDIIGALLASGFWLALMIGAFQRTWSRSKSRSRSRTAPAVENHAGHQLSK